MNGNDDTTATEGGLDVATEGGSVVVSAGDDGGATTLDSFGGPGTDGTDGAGGRPGATRDATGGDADGGADADGDGDTEGGAPGPVTGATFARDLTREQVEYEPHGPGLHPEVGADDLRAAFGTGPTSPLRRREEVTDFRGPDLLLDKLVAGLRPGAAGPDDAPRRRLAGRPGTGKTTLAADAARRLAADDDEWPLDEHTHPVYEVTLNREDDTANLIGHPVVEPDGGGSVFRIGPLVRALLASQVCPTVLILDELNRSRVKEAIYEMLDHRCRLRLTGVAGGTVVQGNPANLAVVSTMNDDAATDTEPVDPAERRRVGPLLRVTAPSAYGEGDTREYPDYDGEAAEVGLLTDLTPADEATARELVEAGQNVRAAARESDRPMRPLSSAALVQIAKEAYRYDADGIPDPLWEAARDVAEGLYDDGAHARGGTARDTAVDALRADLRGVEPSWDLRAVAGDAPDLVAIDGVGPARAEYLADAGFDDALDVATCDPADLRAVKKVGPETAPDIRAAAADALRDAEGFDAGVVDLPDPDAGADGDGDADADGGPGGEAVTCQECDYTVDPDTAELRSVESLGRCPECAAPVET